MVKYTRAFAKALSEHLRGNVPAFTEYRTGDGGCETCGYGAEEFQIIDMDALTREINEFAKRFEE